LGEESKYLSSLHEKKEMEEIIEPAEINIYFVENHLELIARVMLLFTIINKNDLNLREKSELFFEV